MEKPVAIIEITDSCVRLVVGNVVNNKPIIIYTTEKPISGLVARGEIVDFANLVSVISSLTSIKDEEAKLIINVTEATVIFPPIGFQIFQTEKTTNVVSPTSIIEKIDIQNVISLVKKEPVPGRNEIVDIIPDSFILEQNRAFSVPPIGQKSNSITIFPKVHTLPVRVVSSYKEAVENSHIRAKRCLVSPYAISDLIKASEGTPSNYILVDINAGYSAITTIGNHSPFSSAHFLLGENDLILAVSSAFGISEDKAKDLLDTYGINDRSLNFKPVIATSVMDNGSQRTFTLDDLNDVIRHFMKDYFTQLDAAYYSLLSGSSEKAKQLPIIIIGGFDNLYGFENLAKQHFIDASDVILFSTKCIGARDSKYAATIGALLVSSRYKGSLSDQRAKVSQVGRVDENKGK